MLNNTASHTEHKKEKIIEKRKNPISNDIGLSLPAALNHDGFFILVKRKGKRVQQIIAFRCRSFGNLLLAGNRFGTWHISTGLSQMPG